MSNQRKISDIFRPKASSSASSDNQLNRTEEALAPKAEKNISTEESSQTESE